METDSSSLKFKYDLFMLRHKRKVIPIVIFVLVILLVGILGYYNWTGNGSINIEFPTNEQPTQPAEPAQPFWPWEQPAQTTEPVQESACPDESIDIIDLTIDPGLGRVSIKNTGTKSIKFASIIFYDTWGNAIPTDTSLGRTYDYANVDAFTFTDDTVSCDRFSKVIATIECGTTSTFIGKPTKC